MATFKDIQAANKTIKTTPIKGKDYAEVNQRIKAFRMVYPDGFILTNMISNENGVCIFSAQVGYYDGTGNPFTIGTGTAFELETSSYINKTSYIENCETSAVGRALGMAGFGIDTSVASAEEVTNAINQQNAMRPPVDNTPANAPQMPQNAPAVQIEQFTCSVCGKAFTDKKAAAATFKKFGKYACPACIKRKTEEAKAAKAAETKKQLQEFANNNELPFEIV